VTPQFTINFRREAYRQEVARARRRVIALGVWVAYFGVIVIILGLYGLNCGMLSRRVRQIERQTTMLRGAQGARIQWSFGAKELSAVERYVLNPRRWRDRLARLAELVPPNVRLTSVSVNPHGSSGTTDRNTLVIVGTLRGGAGQDRMQDVMGVVARLREDSLFARGYRNVRLASSRVLEDAGAAEFTIECR
jgi:hypothetical protein